MRRPRDWEIRQPFTSPKAEVIMPKPRILTMPGTQGSLSVWQQGESQRSLIVMPEEVERGGELFLPLFLPAPKSSMFLVHWDNQKQNLTVPCDVILTKEEGGWI